MIQGDSVTDKHTVTKQVKENVTDSVTVNGNYKKQTQ